MVPHEATGMLPFLMLYGREALLPKEIEHTTYGSDSDYEKAVAGHISKMFDRQELACGMDSLAGRDQKNILTRSLKEGDPLCVYSRGCGVNKHQELA